MDNYKAIEILEYTKHAYDIRKDASAIAIDKGIEALEKINAIKEIIDNAEDMIEASYGAVIVEGYKEVFDEIKKKLQN